MARPHPTAKQSVNLASNPASPAPRASRIRRDPPPAVKPAKIVLDPDEREQRDVAVGILAFALAIFVITIAFASYGAGRRRNTPCRWAARRKGPNAEHADAGGLWAPSAAIRLRYSDRRQS